VVLLLFVNVVLHFLVNLVLLLCEFNFPAAGECGAPTAGEFCCLQLLVNLVFKLTENALLQLLVNAVLFLLVFGA
jgi:hypothetical protein